MFQYELKEWRYWLWWDKTWKFWPFSWVYVKNKLLWDFPCTFNISKYPWYKYCIWKWKKFIIIVNKNWFQKLEKINVDEKT